MTNILHFVLNITGNTSNDFLQKLQMSGEVFSPPEPSRAKFTPSRRVFRLSRPLAWTLSSYTKQKNMTLITAGVLYQVKLCQIKCKKNLKRLIKILNLRRTHVFHVLIKYNFIKSEDRGSMKCKRCMHKTSLKFNPQCHIFAGFILKSPLDLIHMVVRGLLKEHYCKAFVKIPKVR